MLRHADIIQRVGTFLAVAFAAVGVNGKIGQLFRFERRELFDRPLFRIITVSRDIERADAESGMDLLCAEPDPVGMVFAVLAEIGADKINRIVLLNKADK